MIPRSAIRVLSLVAVLALVNVAADAATAAAGRHHSAVALPDGSVWVWGAIGSAQLDDVEFVSSPVPVPMVGLTNVVALASGDSHLLALTSNGDVWAWGANDSGQVGDGTNEDRRVPVLVLRNAVGIDAGPDCSIAWKTDGSLWSWGANHEGQLGVDTLKPSLMPALVGGITGVVDASAGRGHVLALTAEGSIWSWGLNTAGQLDDGSRTSRRSPAPVTVLRDATGVVAGAEAGYAIREDGSLRAWGANTSGRLGDGTTEARLDAVEVRVPAAVKAVSPGGGHVLARLTDGNLWSWGLNTFGQLGDGTRVSRPAPAPLGLAGVAEIAAGLDHSLAVTADGVVWTWGRNTAGQLGDGTREDSAAPVAISGPGFEWKAGRPVLDPPGGEYEAAQEATVTSATDGASILYSTSPDDLTASETLSGGTISVDEITTILARAFAPDRLPSDVTIAEYILRLPAVQFTPGGGAYAEPQWVRLAGAPGAHIRYTADGSIPDESSALYTDSVHVTTSTTLQARAYKPGWQPSPVAGARYQLGPASASTTPTTPSSAVVEDLVFADGFETGDTSAWSSTFNPVDPPEISPGPGTYETQVVVTITCSGEATTRYTIDESDPTTESPVFSEPFTLATTTTVKAACYRAPSGVSAIEAALFEIRVAQPIFAPPPGDYPWPQDVAITTTTPDAVVTYTDNGSEPTESSPELALGETVHVEASMSLRARAWKPGTTPSVEALGDYTVGEVLASPTFSPPRGSYASPVAVSLGLPVGAVEVRYTTNGDPPTIASPLFTEPIPVDVGLTIRAIAVGPAADVSPVAIARYTLEVGTPTLDPPGGVSIGPVAVTVGTTTPGAAVHYTLDGSEPDEGSPEVALADSQGTIEIDTSSTLKVKAFKSGWTPSFTTTANYFVAAGQVADPTADPPGGTYAGAQSVTLSCATGGATVHFTTNGGEPSLASPIYDSAIPIPASGAIRARAFKPGFVPSATIASVYAIGDGPLSTPLVDPPPGDYVLAQEVLVSSADPGVDLRYTTDGSEPTLSDAEVMPGTPLSIDRITRVRVRAFEDGREPSEILTADYFITGAVAAGHVTSLALDSNGVVWFWGDTNDGETAAPPVPVADLPPIQGIAAGDSHSLALDEDGVVWAWGSGLDGELGNGILSPSTTPVAVSATWGAIEAVAVGAGERFSVALLADGSVWAWGRNDHGQLGTGSGVFRSTTPVPVGGSGSPLTGITAIAVGRAHAVALTASGTVLAWGENTSGQLGDGTTDDAPLPVEVDTTLGLPSDLRAVGAGGSHSAAVAGNGGLWAWGLNADGQLAQPDTGSLFFEPTLVNDPIDVRAAATGLSHSLVVDATMRPWAVGRNVERQLGDGSTVSRTAFVAVFNLDGVITMAAGDYHSLAIRIDGSVWAWGTNLRGQVGEGAGPRTPVPVEVPGLRLAENQSVAEDPDGDGLATALELRLGTDPWDPDTNGDGVPDGASVGAGIDPTSTDSDGDGLSNAAELQIGTDPLDPDTDGDGIADGTDAYPLDPGRWETPEDNPSDTTPPTITLVEPSNAIPIL